VLIGSRRHAACKAQLAARVFDPPLSVVDVGALWGLQPELEPIAAHVDAIGFDPDEPECAELNARAKAAGLRQRFVPHLVAGADGEREFHETRKLASSSLLRPNLDFHRGFPDAQRMEVVATHRVTTRDFAGVLAEVGSTPELLKLDAHGVEADLLRSLDAPRWDALLGVFVEVLFAPLFVGQGEFGEIDDLLRGHGFRMFGLKRYSATRTTLAGPAHRTRGQLTFGDALYLRDGAALDPARRRRLGALAATFDHLDYAAELLTDPAEAALVERMARQPAPPLRVLARGMVAVGRLGERIAGPTRSSFHSDRDGDWF
jgi:FkbM family methyltransferase